MDIASQVEACLAAGDAGKAATVAIEGLGPSVLGYLYTVLGDADDARDAFSMFAEDLWRGLPAFRRECSLRAWAFRLARHAAARLLREAWRRRAQPLPTSAASRLAASIAASGMAPGSRREALARIRAALDLDDQTLLVLRIDKELEWEEIAEVLATDGAPVTAAGLRKRFERLKDRMEKLAREEGLVD
jgi:RNA polymerase sigma-70 factor (ECF subfamily)